jgi:hypothetical protein
MVNPQLLLDRHRALPDHPSFNSGGGMWISVSQTASSLSSPTPPRCISAGPNQASGSSALSDGSKSGETCPEIEHLGFSLGDGQGRLPLGQLMAACGFQCSVVEFEADLLAAQLRDPSRQSSVPVYRVVHRSLQAVVVRNHGFTAES